ncbi:MAG TPA: SIMPL domain-containing protein [Thermoanaerobaculia bacterium]|nr:SIMPL domain-containing protein [Thermoanaerobaculia bacterium]
MKRILMIIALASGAAAALAQQSGTTAPRESAWAETVSVTGTGKATLTPDRVTFTVGVQTLAPTVEEAVNENNQKVQATIAALKKAGAKDTEVQTSNFSIFPQQDYSQQQAGKLPRIIGYQVSNNITVTKDDPAAAGKLLQVAVANGVNQSSGLNFVVSNPTRGRDQGLKAAFDDARAKAALLAQAAGRSIGRALTITEGGAQQPPYPRPMQMAKGAVAEMAVSDIPVESGTQELNYTVSVLFELR